MMRNGQLFSYFTAKIKGSGGGTPVDAYTKAQTDNLLSGKYDGKVIKSGSVDFNDFTTDGVYNIVSSSGKPHSPKGNYHFYVLRVVDGIMQIADAISTNNGNLTYDGTYTRTFKQGAWTDWKKMYGNTATTFDKTSTDAMSGVALAGMSNSITQINQSLDGQGLINKSDIYQGGWVLDSANKLVRNTSSQFVSTNRLSCNSGDVITFKASRQFKYWFAFADSNGVFISPDYYAIASEHTMTAPANAKYVCISFSETDNSNITPQSIGYVGIYINNAIVQINNTLAEQTIIDNISGSTSGTTKEITTFSASKGDTIYASAMLSRSAGGSSLIEILKDGSEVISNSVDGTTPKKAECVYTTNEDCTIKVRIRYIATTTGSINYTDCVVKKNSSTISKSIAQVKNDLSGISKIWTKTENGITMTSLRVGNYVMSIIKGTATTNIYQYADIMLLDEVITPNTIVYIKATNGVAINITSNGHLSPQAQLNAGSVVDTAVVYTAK